MLLAWRGVYGLLFAISATFVSCSKDDDGDASGVSPVQKVITLIDDLAAKVKQDLKSQTDDFAVFARHCDKEAAAKTRAVSDSNAAIEEFAATIEDAHATITSVEAQVSELSQQISEVEAELKTEVSVRQQGNADFVSGEKELLETVDSLSRAATALKKASSFAQLSSDDQSSIQEAIEALGMVIEASWVTKEQKANIDAFLQAQEENDDSDSLSLRATDNEPKGTSAILQTITDMEDKAEEALANLRKEEMESKHAHEMLKAGMEHELRTMKEEMADGTQKKQATVQALAQAEKDSGVEKSSLKETQRFLKGLKHECQAKAASFEVEVKDGNAELKALGEAKAILDKKFSSAAAGANFLQVSRASRSSLRSKARSHMTTGVFYGQMMDGNKAAALREVDRIGRQFHSMSLVSLAFRAAQDPFGKVRAMLEDMIAKLLQEQAEEASQKAFCDKELGESEKSQSDKSRKIEAVQARLEKAESRSAKLSGGVSRLTKEVGEIDSSVTEMTRIRQQEKAVFQVTAKDAQESQEACAAAIQVLQEYYEGGSAASAASLIQVSLRSHSKMTSHAKLQGGQGILGVLEVAEGDFATTLAEARAAEDAAVQEYEHVMGESRVLKAKKLAEAKGKESQLKSLRATLDETMQDKEGLEEELGAVTDYIEKLKPKCETKAPSAEEAKARREQEIEGLKNALSILEGTSIP